MRDAILVKREIYAALDSAAAIPLMICHPRSPRSHLGTMQRLQHRSTRWIESIVNGNGRR
jgi:hypothetical protein